MQSILKHAPKEFIPITTAIHQIECAKSFSLLDKREQLYAYYLARASWEGAKICWFQRSYESPALMVLFKLIYAQNLESLKQNSIQNGVNEVDWRQMLAYSASVMQNCGNYKSFGDTKFVPELEPEKFKKIIQSSDSYQTHREIIDKILELTEKEIYAETDPFYQIGFRDNNGTTSYYSSNVTSTDAKLIDEFCQKEKISPLNTRLFKISDVEYELRIASQLESKELLPYLKTFDYNGIKIHVKAADFTEIMQKVVQSLENALHFVSNENQKNMITAYIEHFKYGDIEKHKDSQRYWIKDVGPIVETDIGFIETYLDPSGARAEFEGFVAIVDKETSAKFNNLVQNAEQLISYLPWAKDFEKDKFSKPDFTNLDIVAFACSGTPIGINIPNYDDIRMNEGFKNVNLGNAYPKPKAETLQFLREHDVDLMVKYSKESLTLIVALHELLGHGTGKLLTKNVETGELNFPSELKNPYTGEPITTYYLSTETWSQKFGKLHSGYEECRADTVALYLMHYDEPFHIFCTNLFQQHFLLVSDRKAEWDDIYYTAWMDIFHSSIKGLQFYNTEQQVWGQAHVLASYVIFQVIRESDPQLIELQFTKKDDKDYFYLHVDRTKLRTIAFKGLSDFLAKLHIFKSMGDFDAAKKMFDHYSVVDETMIKVRQIVLENKIPRRIELQPNLFLNPATNQVEYKDYQESFEGVIHSFAERYPNAFQDDVYKQWIQDAHAVRRVD